MTRLHSSAGHNSTRRTGLLTAAIALVASVSVTACGRSVPAGEPATVEAATQLLDLRTFPVLEGAKISSHRTLGMLMYEADGDAKSAYDFQRQQLTKRGWKEQKGGYQDANNASGQFGKDGYALAVSASGASGEAEKSGRAHVSVINHGNVDVAKLPVPPGVKPFYSSAGQTSYLTEAKVPETAEACRKLLLAAGWEPYGSASADPESPMLYFKRNAIRIMAWTSTAPAQGNKTVIRYSADLLAADLPMPPDAPDPRYDDVDKTVRFDWPGEDGGKVLAFYQARLVKQDWKPTTERPVTDDKRRTQFLIFRNPQGDMISLDLERFTGIVRVKVQHQSAAEVAEAERLAKEAAERSRAEIARKQVKVEVPLPAMADNVKQEKPDHFEFKVGKGEGRTALAAFREHFSKAGWTEEEGTREDANSGGLNFKKGDSRVRFTYFDIGIGDADISVHGFEGVTLVPKPALDKPARIAGTKPQKKTALADIPGLPKLPAGVELPEMPEEVGDLLKKLDDPASSPSGAKKSAKKQETATGKKPAIAASGAPKVADLSMPPDATSIEYTKTTKMIKLTTPSDAATLARFFIDELGKKGWQEPSKSLINDNTAIVKLARGDASLTIFVHKRDDGNDATIVSKGVDWDAVPKSRIAAKKATTKRPDSSAPNTAIATKPAKPADTPRVAAVRITQAEQTQTGATMWSGAKVYKLAYGVAYQSKQGDDTRTEVMLAVKPIAIDKLVALLNHGKDGGDAAGFDPHMRLRFDAAGKLSYLFLYADGLSVSHSGSSHETVQAELTLADGRARGKAVMEKPTKFFDSTYRFDVAFDARLVTAAPKAGDASAPAPANEELGAEEQGGLPVPLIASSRSSVGNQFRKSVTVSVPAPLIAMVNFYRRELPARGWKENAQATKVGSDSAQLAFTGPEGNVIVRLAKQGDETSADLAVRYPAKAKAAGIIAQPNRSRLILGNASDREAMVVINGQPYKVPAGAGAKDPKNGVSLNLQPGKYTLKFKAAGQPERSEEVKITIDETWGVIVLPTGGLFVDQLY